MFTGKWRRLIMFIVNTLVTNKKDWIFFVGQAVVNIRRKYIFRRPDKALNFKLTLNFCCILWYTLFLNRVTVFSTRRHVAIIHRHGLMPNNFKCTSSEHLLNYALNERFLRKGLHGCVVDRFITIGKKKI